MTVLGEKPLIGIFGAGGFGREVMPFAYKAWHHHFDLVFIETAPTQASVNGYKLISLKEFSEHYKSEKYFNVAVADSRARARLTQELTMAGGQPISIFSPNAIMYECSDIGQGAIICANSVISANTVIGEHFHCNFGCYVAHDCQIADYVTFAPAVQCLGNVHISDHAYIGAGAVIKQGTRDHPRKIGEGALIGMGAVVTKDVPPYTTVVGNPANPLRKSHGTDDLQDRS